MRKTKKSICAMPLDTAANPAKPTVPEMKEKVKNNMAHKSIAGALPKASSAWNCSSRRRKPECRAKVP
jgi:hypothetical protein